MVKISYEKYLDRPSGARRKGGTGRAPVGAQGIPTAGEIDAAVRRLPALPALLHEIMRELRDDDADIGRLEDRIASDASLTTRVLKMANSPFYSRSAEVVDVRRAVLTLGFRTVANLVMAAGLRNTIGGSQKIPTYTRDGVFLISLASGMACERLARKVPALRPHADEMFVAGLLHDIGRIALGPFYGRLSASLPNNDGVTIDPAFERQHLGTDHQQVGGVVLERWGIPGDLVPPVTRHHDPVDAIADEPVILAVALVDAAMEMRGFARNVRVPRWAERVDAIHSALGTDAALIQGILDTAEEEAEAIAGAFA